jgi:hypothetical protein
MTHLAFVAGVRKATWGAALLGLFALTFGSPVRESRALHGIVSLCGLAGYILLSLDPAWLEPRRRQLLIAGVVCSLVSFVLVVTSAPFPATLVARVLAVATIALPIWLVDRPAQFAFVVAGALALFTGLPAVASAGLYATSVHAYVAAAAAFWVAWRIHAPHAIGGDRKPRMVVASNIVTLTPEEKAAALARIERRWKDGEIPEHKYWDLRQEIESR